VNNPGNTAIEKLSANVIDTRFEDLEPATVETTKYRIVDTLGCLIGGSTDTGNPELAGLLKDEGGKEEATILIHGGKVPAGNAALVNSVMARSFDFEPVSPLVEGVNTPGLAARILAASGFGFTLGWDGTGTVNAFGAAAIAGRLLGLNKLQMRNAFGIVLNQIGSTFQIIWDGTTAFKLPQGLSARSGVFAAQLANAGWTGPEDALFSKFGYYKMFTEGCQKPEALTGELGKIYYADGTIKPYPCCRIPHAAIDCALALVKQHGIKPDDIQEANLYVAQGGIDHICGHPFKIGPFPHGNAAFSYQYVVGTALLYGSVKPEHFTEKAIRDSRINAFFGKVKLIADDTVPFESARLELVLNDGRKLTEYTEIAKSELLSILENLEELDSAGKLIPLLTV